MASWDEGSGVLRPELVVAWESPDELALRSRQNTRRLPPGMVAAPVLTVGMVSVTLPTPLGTRRLVDADSGREIRYLDGRRLAEVTWLPAGYRFEEDAVPLQRSPGPTVFAWTRSYAEYGAPPTARRELAITQASLHTSAGFATLWPISAHVTFGERPAIIREHTNPDTGLVDRRALCWATDTYNYCVASTMVGHPAKAALIREILLRIAAGLREPSR